MYCSKQPANVLTPRPAHEFRMPENRGGKKEAGMSFTSEKEPPPHVDNSNNVHAFM